MIHSLYYYFSLAAEQNAAAAAAKGKSYNPDRDTGLFGDALELAMKGWHSRPLKLSPAGKPDDRIDGRYMEYKSGAFEFGNVGESLLKGAGLVLFVPVVNLDKPITEQEGFVMDKAEFIDLMYSIKGAVRIQKNSAGTMKVHLQTFWNRGKNAPHGRLYERLLDALYENAQTLEDFLAEHPAR